MNIKRYCWLFVALLSLTTNFCTAKEMLDPNTGSKFPDSVSFDYQGKEYHLTGTGVATRKKFFIKVYSVASYVENPANLKTGNLFNNILSSDQAKQLTLIFERDVPKDKLVSGYRESFGKVTHEDKESIEQFLGFFQNVKAKEMHIIRWLPDGTVTLSINGKEVGSIKDPKFAKDLWGIWFSDAAVVDRGRLTGELSSNS